MNKRLLSVTIGVTLSINAMSQSSSLTTGGDASNSNGSFSYSVGQLFTENYTSAAGAITEGVQQSFDLSVLPVKLVSFTAKIASDKNILLNWATSSEINTSHFEIEHSLNSNIFSYKGSVKSSLPHNSGYSFKHLNPSQGINYYRLKLVDKDGKFSYSDIQSVELNSCTNSISVYPNPSTDYILITTSNIASNFQYTVSSLMGGVVKSGVASNSLVKVDVSDLSKGIYLIAISTDSQKEIFKIIKL